MSVIESEVSSHDDYNLRASSWRVSEKYVTAAIDMQTSGNTMRPNVDNHLKSAFWRVRFLAWITPDSLAGMESQNMFEFRPHIIHGTNTYISRRLFSILHSGE